MEMPAKHILALLALLIVNVDLRGIGIPLTMNESDEGLSPELIRKLISISIEKVLAPIVTEQ